MCKFNCPCLCSAVDKRKAAAQAAAQTAKAAAQTAAQNAAVAAQTAAQNAAVAAQNAAQNAAVAAQAAAQTAAEGARTAAYDVKDRAQSAVQKIADDFNEGKITLAQIAIAGAAVLMTGVVIGMIIAPKKVQINVDNNGITEEDLAEAEEAEETEA